MAASSKLTPEQRRAEAEAKNQELLLAFEKEVSFVPEKTTNNVRKEKLDKKNQAAAAKPKSSGGLRKGFEGLGDPEKNAIFYIKPSADAGDQGRFNLKLCDSETKNASTCFPTFFQSPPFVIAQSSFMGLGREKPKTDSVLERKFNLLALYGIFKKDENGNITNKLDVHPIFSKNRTDIWKNNNPMGHTEKEKISLSYEINAFHERYQAFHKQLVNYIASDPDKIVFVPVGNDRAVAILDGAREIADEYFERVREQMNDEILEKGSSKIPNYELKQWREKAPYKVVEQQAMPDAVFKLLGSPDVCTIEEVQFRSLLISSYSEDIMKNKSKTVKGVGMTNSDVLRAAIEQADNYIAENPDWKDRLFMLRFECPVWKFPAAIADSKEKRDALIAKANDTYKNILADVKEKNKNLKEWDIKKLADSNFYSLAIRPPFECKYNLPDIRDCTRNIVPDYSFKEASDKYNKMHFAFTPGATVNLNFMVNISLPTAYSFPFAFKLTLAGCIEFMFPSRYKRGNENTFDHFLSFGETSNEFQTYVSVSTELENDKKNKKTRTDNNGIVDDDDPDIFGGNKLVGLEGAMHGMTDNPQIRIDPNEEAIRDFVKSAGLVSEKQVIQKQSEAAQSSTDELIDLPIIEQSKPATSNPKRRRAF